MLGVTAPVSLMGNIFLLFSPGVLDGLEYVPAAAPAVLEVPSYGSRDRTLSDRVREALISGGSERR